MMKAGSWAALLLCMVALPAFAEEGPANTFRPLPTYEPLPGQAVSTDSKDLRIREALPLPCQPRKGKWAEAGSWIGGMVGAMAGIAALGKDGDSSVTTAAKGLAGAGIGSTVGYLAGRAYDGPPNCPDAVSRLPRVPISPVGNEVEWEERRRALAGGP